MNITFRVLGFTLVLPVVAFAAAVGALQTINGKVRDQISRQYPSLSQQRLAEINVPYLNAHHAFSSPALPNLYSNLQLVRDASIATAVLGLLLIGTVAAAGRAARQRRDLLLRFFRPGLYLTLISAGVPPLTEIGVRG